MLEQKTTTNEEFEALCAALLPKFNEYLMRHSKNIFSCELATSLDGIKTMPALYDLDGVQKQVIAPLALLTKDVDIEIEESKKATAAAKEAAGKANEAAASVTKATTDLTTERKKVEDAVSASKQQTAAAKQATEDTLASKTAIEKNETARQQAEQTRQSQETARQQAESTRNSNETTRKSQEATRVSQETARQSAETTRNANEETRKKKETTRQSQEAARVEAEESRKAAESNRADAETKRTQTETDRSTHESQREEAETQRKANDTQRTADYQAIYDGLQAKSAEIDRLLASLQQQGSVAPMASIPASIATVEEVTVLAGATINVAPTDVQPLTANRSMIYQIYSGDALVDAAGNVKTSTAGDIIVKVIPTLASGAAKIVTIHVKEAEALTDESGNAITDENETEITC